MPTIILPFLLAAVAGVAAVTQQVFNANLRGVLDSAGWAAVVSYAVGLICVLGLALASGDPLPSLAVARGSSWYLWTGGALGAIPAFIVARTNGMAIGCVTGTPSSWLWLKLWWCGVALSLSPGTSSPSPGAWPMASPSTAVMQPAVSEA